MKKQHLVLAGAGHAHMVTMAGISDIKSLGHEVTVIGPSDYHYYSGMGPGMLGSGYEPDDIRFAVRRTIEAQGGTFIRDAIAGVDPDSREVYWVHTTLDPTTFGLPDDQNRFCHLHPNCRSREEF